MSDVTDRNIPGPGGDIPVRIYTPAGSGPFPIIVYCHGGGWVLADLDTYDASARALASEAEAIVVSADYRHAPEHKFPAAREDAVAAYRWAVENAASFDGDASRTAVAGESAGGNVAAHVAMTARDQQLREPIRQVLIYPVAGTDMMTASYEDSANAKPLNSAMMAWFFGQYLRGPEDRRDPRINLVEADLRGLPPATVITAGIDPLRSDGQLLAERLTAAGVPVAYRTYDGATHEFFGAATLVQDARHAQRSDGEELRQAFTASS